MRTDYSDLAKIDQISELVLRALRGRADQKRVLTQVREALGQMRGQITFLRNEREKLLGMVANQPERTAEKSKA